MKDASVQNLIHGEFDELDTGLIDEISECVNEKYIELFYLESEKAAAGEDANEEDK